MGVSKKMPSNFKNTELFQISSVIYWKVKTYLQKGCVKIGWKHFYGGTEQS